jgi:hypothetical protein
MKARIAAILRRWADKLDPPQLVTAQSGIGGGGGPLEQK